MPERVILCVGVRVTSRPRTKTAPSRGGTRPSMLRISVVLPMPLRPINATVSPGPTLKSTPCRMWLAP